LVSLPDKVISCWSLHWIIRTNRSMGTASNCCILRYSTVLLSGWWLQTSRRQILPPIPRLKKAKLREWQILRQRQYPHDPEAHNTSLHCRTSLELYECLSQSNCYFFSHTYDHCTELHTTAEGPVTFQ
jgi:hypothetical protein